jgi:cyclase
MIRPRIIPCLLLKGHGFVKTKKFRDSVYLGDPINIVRIFNEKEVDEITILDIEATLHGSVPAFDFLRQIATECFVPLAYGGGVRSVEDARTLFRAGFEKVCVNTLAQENPSVVKAMADRFGSQSIVASIDVKRGWLGRYEVFTHSGTQGTGIDPVEAACRVVEHGAGEILLTSIDRDGTYQGYDLELVRRVTAAVNVPVIASGGAARAKDLVDVIQVAGAAAAAAGSLFVFHGPLHAVLINMPSTQELNALALEQKQEKKR